MMKLSIRIVIAFAVAALSLRAADDKVFADFEGETYGEWKVEGTAFGAGPAKGTLPGQMAVEGFLGKRLVNSFNGGDKSTGKLTSPEFTITHRYVSFLIGGGGFEGKTCMNLLVDGKVVRTATGPNTQSGGSERLEASGWDVGEFAGKQARIEIVDDATGGWGHVNVDQIVFTETKPTLARTMRTNVSIEITASNRWLNFPVKTGGKKRVVTVAADGKQIRRFDIELADGEPDWFAPLDISAWAGKKLTINVNQLADDSKALERISQSDATLDAKGLYREALRPQFHFSAQRGWLNDPNGLVFFNGEYHLFFQHNPYGWAWGNMHWGHAVSRDLVHWREVGEALYPDELGPMFSGSAVVDAKNTSGFGADGKAPLVLIYTAAGNPSVQCVASSLDGRAFTKYSGNPVVKQITGGNRDPKVFWHEPTQKWVMALYVGLPGKANAKETNHTIHFLTSTNLREWKVASHIDGFFECPDMFELPLDGDASKKKWVLTAASSEYMVGAFDGETFTPETPKLKGHLGRGFYAAQTYSNEPKGRRIQIGWFQAPPPGMAFNQAMTIPLELSLRSTPAGPRLAWAPVEEMKALRGDGHKFAATLKAGESDILGETKGGLLELRAEFKPAGATAITLSLRGIPITYDVSKQEIEINKHRAPAPMKDGVMTLRVFVDRTTVEVFASDGLTYVPMPVISKAAAAPRINVTGGEVEFKALELYELKSIWDAGK